MSAPKLQIANLTNAAATGAWHEAPSGVSSVIVRGTFDSGTVTVEVSDDGGTTALSLGTNGDFTANGVRTLELPEGMKVRAKVAGHGASVDVDVLIHALPKR